MHFADHLEVLPFPFSLLIHIVNISLAVLQTMENSQYPFHWRYWLIHKMEIKFSFSVVSWVETLLKIFQHFSFHHNLIPTNYAFDIRSEGANNAQMYHAELSLNFPWTVSSITSNAALGDCTWETLHCISSLISNLSFTWRTESSLYFNQKEKKKKDHNEKWKAKDSRYYSLFLQFVRNNKVAESFKILWSLKGVAML